METESNFRAVPILKRTTHFSLPLDYAALVLH